MKKFEILFLDSDPLSYPLIQGFFESRLRINCQIEFCLNCDEARAKFFPHTHFDLLISNLTLCGSIKIKSLIELIRSQEKPDKPKTRFLAWSSYSLTSDAEAARDYGFEEFVVKNGNFRELSEAIFRLIPEMRPVKNVLVVSANILDYAFFYKPLEQDSAGQIKIIDGGNSEQVFLRIFSCQEHGHPVDTVLLDFYNLSRGFKVLPQASLIRHNYPKIKIIGLSDVVDEEIKKKSSIAGIDYVFDISRPMKELVDLIITN